MCISTFSTYDKTFFRSSADTFTATSTAVPAGRGVGGCYNNLTGSSRVLELKTKGDVTAPDC